MDELPGALPAVRFSNLDILIVLAGIAALLVVGFFAGRGEKTTRDFFLGGRGLPAWAVCLSFIATEISAATIVAVPAKAYSANWQYLQLFIGSALARVAVAFIFIPAFFRIECTTIYEFLRHRFGPGTQYTASIFFFLTRALGSGLRLYIAAMGSAMIIGWYETNGPKSGIVFMIALFTVVGIAFIAFGGVKAVIWTNVLQAMVFISGGVATLAYLLHRVHGGIDQTLATAQQANRLSIINIHADLSDAYFLPVAAATGFLTSLAVFGTDQDLMQRLLTVNSRRASQKSLLSTIVVALPVLVVFLSVGTLLYVFYTQNPSLPRPPGNRSDEILPLFAATVLPSGLKGLLLLTILMASIDSPLGSLSSSFVTDIYRPLIRRSADERHYLAVSRLSVAGFGVLLAGIAYGASFLNNSLLDVAFQILGVLSGPMLGAFLLGLLTRRRGDSGTVLAMVFSGFVSVILAVLINQGKLQLGWSWLIVIGTTLTFSIGMALSQPADAHDSDRFQRI